MKDERFADLFVHFSGKTDECAMQPLLTTALAILKLLYHNGRTNSGKPSSIPITIDLLPPTAH